MRSSTSLYGGIFIGIALQARNLNENLENNLQPESFSVSSVCSVDYLLEHNKKENGGLFCISLDLHYL